MDVDVKGAINIKKRFGDEALSIFVMPPSLGALESRLRGRGTDTPETISRRLAKAEYEMSFAKEFDTVVVNGALDAAVKEVASEIRRFAF